MTRVHYQLDGGGSLCGRKRVATVMAPVTCKTCLRAMHVMYANFFSFVSVSGGKRCPGCNWCFQKSISDIISDLVVKLSSQLKEPK